MTLFEFAHKMFIIDLQEGTYEEDPTIQTWEDLLPNERQSYLKEAEVYLKLPKEEWIDFEYYNTTNQLTN